MQTFDSRQREVLAIHKADVISANKDMYRNCTDETFVQLTKTGIGNTPMTNISTGNTLMRPLFSPERQVLEMH